MLTGELQNILDAELVAGNSILEEESTDSWPYSGGYFVMLKKPFMTPIRRDMEGVVFRNINDPHYWKAEYDDQVNKCILVCGFDGVPDFSEM